MTQLILFLQTLWDYFKLKDKSSRSMLIIGEFLKVDFIIYFYDCLRKYNDFGQFFWTKYFLGINFQIFSKNDSQ
jgi:hypothetical protein